MSFCDRNTTQHNRRQDKHAHDWCTASSNASSRVEGAYLCPLGEFVAELRELDAEFAGQGGQVPHRIDGNLRRGDTGELQRGETPNRTVCVFVQLP